MTGVAPPPPWTATSVLEKSYLMARDNFAAFVTISLIFGAVSLVVDVLDLGVLSLIVSLICSVATSICLTWGALQAMSGRKPEWEPMLRQVQGPLFGRLLALGVIQYLVIGLSAVLVIPPFFLLPLWFVTIPAMMIERGDIADTFNRSIDLTRHRRLTILFTFLLWAVVVALGGAVIWLLLGDGPLSHLVLWIYGAVAGTVLHPLPAIFYLLLREEKEGVTVERITAALD